MVTVNLEWEIFLSHIKKRKIFLTLLKPLKRDNRVRNVSLLSSSFAKLGPAQPQLVMISLGCFHSLKRKMKLERYKFVSVSMRH